MEVVTEDRFAKNAGALYCYRVWDLLLESCCPLPALTGQRAGGSQLPESETVWRFAVRALTAPCPPEDRWIHHCTDADGAVWFSLAHEQDGYWMRFPETADFRISLRQREVLCCPAADIPPETIEHLLLDHVLPRALSATGRHILHASAVRTPAGAAAFLGNSGQGKSTLAASLAQRGFPLLTDDSLLLEEQDGQFYARPGYPGLRLWGESLEALRLEEAAGVEVAHYTSKRRLDLPAEGQTRAGQVPLRRIYLLDPDETGLEAPAVLPLPPREAFLELLTAAMLLDVTAPETQRRSFEITRQLLQQGLFYRLRYPRRFDRLAEVQAAILEDLRRTAPRGIGAQTTSQEAMRDE